MLKQDRLLGDSVISTRDLGEELAKISLDLAKRENATYAELRLVNTRSEDVSVVNENPASEEASTIGVGIRVLYKDSGWGFADTDELEHDSIRETTKKALSLAKGASKLGIKVTRAQRRSIQQNTGGGYELIDEMDLPGQALELTKDAVSLTHAPTIQEGKSDIILSGDQVALQVHESCGHPIELDRVLGYEANFAGRSFLQPDQLGKLQYGSEHVNIVMDATLDHGNGLGTFGYDDEGVKAQRKYAVKNGKFVGYLMSRETAPRVGESRSNGCMRAEYYKLPIIRMTNVSLEPGEWDYDEMIEDTRDGYLMVTNYGWSIDQKRYNFQFNTEKGYRIKNGSIGEMVRGPTYAGITPEFWNSCDAIANKKSWVLWGTPNCGKGQPGQTMITGHGASPSRFRNIRVFGAS